MKKSVRRARLPGAGDSLAIAVAALGLGQARLAFAQNILATSSNWSGYDAAAPAGEAFTDVSSTWVIPKLTATPSGETYSSYWVGFDGVTGSNVEQCGVSADISSSGSMSYSAWYEFAPAAENVVSLSVNAGDTIFADVTYEGHSASGYGYNFHLLDETTGGSFDSTKYTSRNDARSTAEWIAEVPSLGSSITNLANFGSVTFSNAAAALNGASDAALGTLNCTENEMEQNVVVALPTSISSTDTAFNVTYEPTTVTWDNAGAYGPSDGSTWDFAGNNNWNSGFANAAYTDGDSVVFNDNNNGNYAVKINSYFMHPASVTVNSSGNYTISGSGHIGGAGSLTKSGTGTLTLSTTNSYSGGTYVTAGGLIIEPTGSGSTALSEGALSISGSGMVQLAYNTTEGSQSADVPLTAPTSNVVLTSLAISGSGMLDITNNHIIIDYSASDPINSIAAWITNGYAGGAWNGTGIMSSAAQVNFASYGVGYADSADPGNPAGLASGQIEIMYTLLGDANLDGKVNGTDFNILAANFNTGGDSWDQGDFNYDGKVNGSDFNLLAANFNQGATQSADFAALESFAAANGISGSVPEPGVMSVLVSVSYCVLGNRRRRSARTQ